MTSTAWSPQPQPARRRHKYCYLLSRFRSQPRAAVGLAGCPPLTRHADGDVDGWGRTAGAGAEPCRADQTECARTAVPRVQGARSAPQSRSAERGASTARISCDEPRDSGSPSRVGRGAWSHVSLCIDDWPGWHLGGIIRHTDQGLPTVALLRVPTSSAWKRSAPRAPRHSVGGRHGMSRGECAGTTTSSSLVRVGRVIVPSLPAAERC